MTFRAGWEPWLLVVRALLPPEGVWHTLDPVFQQNGYEAPDWRGGFNVGGHRVSANGSAKR